MPEDDVIERARANERERKSPSTQAGEFVREEKLFTPKKAGYAAWLKAKPARRIAALINCFP
jgi:hypothetical protein